MENGIAKLSFVTDSMVPKMKKMLSKDSSRKYSYNPAIDVEAGVMIAVDGHYMVVHKLQDYHFEHGEQTMLPANIVLPEDVLKMKGKVTVTLFDNREVVAIDEEGNRAQQKQFAFPSWRTAIPECVGKAIEINAIALLYTMKELAKEITDKSYPIRVHGEQGSDELTMEWNPAYYETPPSRKVGIGSMPYKMDVALSIKRLNNILAFKPEKMHFAGTTRAMLFTNSDSLLLLMPMLGNDVENIDVPGKQTILFDVDGWIGTLGEVVVDNRHDSKIQGDKVQGNKADANANGNDNKPKATSIEQRLREAMMSQLLKAA